MSQDALDSFGSFLMKAVRDGAITHWDMVLNGAMKDEGSQKFHAAVASLPPEAVEILSALVPKVVDTSLHTLLQSLEESNDIEITVKTDSGECVSIADASDGLAGELYSDKGWFARFSEKRLR